MKNILKKMIPIFIIIFFNIFIISYASIVELTDEEADKKAKQDLIKQQEDDEKNAGKSSNNYLETLSVKGYSLSPEFDKQTINYTIGEELNVDSLEIEAKSEDERATVLGQGKVMLKLGENEIKIDVIAENQTTRTYFIKVNTTAQNKNEVENEVENSIEVENIVENNIEIEESKNVYNANVIETEKNEEKNKSLSENLIIFLPIAIVLIIIIASLVIRGKNKHQ